jgi:hypothetical protein
MAYLIRSHQDKVTGPVKAMKKQHLKYNLKEILIIVFFWLFAIAMLYVVYLKFKFFY